jgi:hypothetical protein
MTSREDAKTQLFCGFHDDMTVELELDFVFNVLAEAQRRSFRL